MRTNDDAPMTVADENVTTPTLLASVSMLIEAVRSWLPRSPSFVLERQMSDAEFVREVEENQLLLRGSLRATYDFIVCGSGSVRRGCGASAGGASQRLGAADRSRRHRQRTRGGNGSGLAAQSGQCARLGLHSLAQSAPERARRFNEHGQVLGGGSSINVMVWARGHKSDWDYFAAEAGDPACSYESILSIYREIENWQGAPDPARRGRDGLLYITPPIEPNPVAVAMLDAAGELGIPVFDDQNGAMMEGPGGAAYFNLRIRDGRRQSIFRSYTFPLMNRPNLTEGQHDSRSPVRMSASSCAPT